MQEWILSLLTRSFKLSINYIFLSIRLAFININRNYFMLFYFKTIYKNYCVTKHDIEWVRLRNFLTNCLPTNSTDRRRSHFIPFHRMSTITITDGREEVALWWYKYIILMSSLFFFYNSSNWKLNIVSCIDHDQLSLSSFPLVS